MSSRGGEEGLGPDSSVQPEDKLGCVLRGRDGGEGHRYWNNQLPTSSLQDGYLCYTRTMYFSSLRRLPCHSFSTPMLLLYYTYTKEEMSM